MSDYDQATSQDATSIHELQTPAPLVEVNTFDHNLAVMAERWPGATLRPHVKAHKCTELARRQAAQGHRRFTCATIREAEGMFVAGLGEDLLVANEVLDARRLGALVERGAGITLAIDSPETLEAAVAGGVRQVLIDVNVGLPRCGCDPGEAGHLADAAREAGLQVLGTMGYEGHAVGIEERAKRTDEVTKSGHILADAGDRVGGEIRSGGGTGSWDLNHWVTEMQAGSYALMDTAYGHLDLPFGQAFKVLASVISVNRTGGWAVADCGLKALGMDHGLSTIEGHDVLFTSDEHIVFCPQQDRQLPQVGDRIRVIPAHIDPTVAYHQAMYLVDGEEILDRWPVDLRGW